MEKTIVIYKSKYGSTEKYAQWIGEALNCPIKKLEDCSSSDLKEYDNIIYGGGVHAGGISGFDKFRRWIRKYLWLVDKPEKNIIVFAVGINIFSQETRTELRDINFKKSWLKGLTCYYLPGAYEPSKVHGADKALMNMVHKMLTGKGNSQMMPEDRVLIDAIEKGCDMVDKDEIEKIVADIRGE